MRFIYWFCRMSSQEKYSYNFHVDSLNNFAKHGNEKGLFASISRQEITEAEYYNTNPRNGTEIDKMV